MTLPDHTLKANQAPIAIWGGIECTVNRVHNRYFDQLALNGHQQRINDLDDIAALGIKTLRYPILWEKIAPYGLATADWSWADKRMERLQQLGIKPIVGLLHHGSGPVYTSLADVDFSKKLADYAYAVAERYPWVEAYTPINEPLTTARFSGLYGFWYPHGKDDQSFAHILLNQCEATIQAMAAIRQVNPSAQLIQTEDYGQTQSSALLSYQARFENKRRLLGFDLLTGQLTPKSDMWRYLVQYGAVAENRLAWFLDNVCPPDIMGINYYVTSDRYLDENCQQYPHTSRGGNKRHAYADVESVRTPVGLVGHKELLSQLWQRYGIPLAATEVHLNCTRDEQLRWLEECYQNLTQLRGNGVDVRALTVWALLGAFNWDCLLTHEGGCYEPGVFDLRSHKPRKTRLADWISQTNHNTLFHHPVLDQPGWWHRPEGQLYPTQQPTEFNMALNPAIAGQPVLITGATGTLGQAFTKICRLRGLPHILTDRHTLDIGNRQSVIDVLNHFKPWAVINTAGYVRVDDAEQDVARCLRENADGPDNLAQVCQRLNIPLVTYSSDLVFDGEQTTPYVESDLPNPLNVYGRSKFEAEQRVSKAMPKALIIRTGGFIGPWDQYNWLTVSLAQAMAGQTVQLPDDMAISLTYVPDLVNATLNLLIDGESGIWHLTSQSEQLTWFGLVHEAARLFNLDPALIKPCSVSDMPWVAKRPKQCRLGSEKAWIMPSIATALADYAEVRIPPALAPHVV